MMINYIAQAMLSHSISDIVNGVIAFKRIEETLNSPDEKFENNSSKKNSFDLKSV